MFDLIFMLAMGLLFLILGLLIWKKQKITLIHDYHYYNVKAEDKKAYTEKMGKATVFMSVGMFPTGIINFLTATKYGWVCFGISFGGGLLLMIRAQYKYNGGIF